MDVNSISNYQNMINSKNKKDTPKQEIDKEFFMKMLVAQLKHQDPLSPVDNNEYMNQSVQFSTLEAIQALNERLEINLNQSKAYSFLGNNVAVSALNTKTDVYEYIEGKVDSVSYSNGEIYIHIGDHIAKPDNVIAVTVPETQSEVEPTPPAPENDDTANEVDESTEVNDTENVEESTEETQPTENNEEVTEPTNDNAINQPPETNNENTEVNEPSEEVNEVDEVAEPTGDN